MKVENGHNVQVHYKGTLSDGTEFDSSYMRNQTLDFEVGAGKMLKGFDSALLGMSEGQSKTITLSVHEAYGPRIPGAIQRVPKEAFGENFEFKVGHTVQGQGPHGPFVAKILGLEGEDAVLDLNHPLAGEDLTFEIELVSTQEQVASVNWSASMKKTELLEVARSHGLKVNTKSTKAQILEALQA